MHWLRTSKGALRLRCAVLLTVPIFVVHAAPVMPPDRTGQLPAAWSRWLLPLVAAYLLIAPFVAEALLRRRREAHPEDLDRIVLLVGVGGSSTVSVLALLLLTLAGASLARVYVWVAISLAGGIFWCARYWRVLR